MATIDQIGPLLTVREAARLLHVHPNTLRRWSNRGTLAAYHITARGDRRFALRDVNSLLWQVRLHNGIPEAARQR